MKESVTKKSFAERSTTTNTRTKDTSKRKTILLVGDWVVDEYWFLVRHHSEISSHTGFMHYRLSSKPTDHIRDLCGAGHVARVLYQLRENTNSTYEIYGIGKWNKLDTDSIGHLIHSRTVECPSSSIQFNLHPEKCSLKPRIKLIPLNPEDDPTIRVIRQYHKENGKFTQINRIDWEPDRANIDEEPIDNNFIEKLPTPETIAHVIIHDFGKGAITPKLIQQLKTKYKGSQWHVRSKVRNPSWLTDDITKLIDFFVIGPEVATLLYPWDNWLSRGRVTAHGMEIIREFPGKNVVLISDQREIIVCSTALEKVFTTKSSQKPTALNQLGWPSAVVAAFIHRAMTRDGDSLDEDDVRFAVETADELGGLKPNTSNDRPCIDEIDEQNPPKPQLRHQRTNVTVKKLVDERGTWEIANNKMGIIHNSDGTLCLEVWRSTAYLKGYITCIKEKREIIGKIMRNMRAYKNSGTPNNSLSILLQADPGSGKTLLAKCLAEAFNFSLVRRDITQMMHREELLGLFEEIANRQTDVGRNVLIFVDEINALLDSNHVYGSFLTPLEEGFYVRDGRFFPLKPAVWIFAGTAIDEDDLEKGEKMSDFKSRMSLIESLDYSTLEKRSENVKIITRNEARLEQVYLGATMIRKAFPDVSTVTKEVLAQFHNLDPAKGPSRDIRKMAYSLRNVKYGRVDENNCENWDEASWGGLKDGDKYVTLIF